jgi:hypothetical protein
MKNYLKFSIAISFMIIVNSVNLFAQTPESAVKSTLNNLFNYSKSKAYEKAALLIAYDGEDKNRNQKEAYNPANQDEFNQVKRKCKEIAALIELSNKYEIGKFSTSTLDGKEVYIFDVSFISGEQKLVKTYTFTKAGNGFLLVKAN